MGFALVVSRRCNQLHRLTGDRDQCTHGQGRFCWLTPKRAEKLAYKQCSKARETGAMSLVTRTLLALEIIPRDLPNRVKASFTSVGNSADLPTPLLRLSPATGHVTDILDLSDPGLGYDANTCPSRLHQALKWPAVRTGSAGLGRPGPRSRSRPPVAACVPHLTSEAHHEDRRNRRQRPHRNQDSEYIDRAGSQGPRCLTTHWRGCHDRASEVSANRLYGFGHIIVQNFRIGALVCPRIVSTDWDDLCCKAKGKHRKMVRQ
jgi:hypothetical protein